MALRFVDVAQSRALRGYPMETHEETPARIHRTASLIPEALYVKRQSMDVIGLQVIFAHRAERRDVPHGERRFEDFVETRRRSLRRILRKERHHEQAFNALFFDQSANARFHRGLPVAHRPDNAHAVTQLLLELPSGFLRMNNEGRPFFRPDALIPLCGLRRTHAQDDAVKNRPPLPLRKFNHAAVRQEFRQILPHSARFRRLGRTGINEKKRGLRTRRCAGGVFHEMLETLGGGEPDH